MMKKLGICVVLILCGALAFMIWLKRKPGRETALRGLVSDLGLRVSPGELGARRFGPAPEPDVGEAPNVLIIAFDNVRADRMSCYGGPRPTTPNLDALAERGTRFVRCVAQAPYTPHSFASMLSSLYVSDLEVRMRARVSDGNEIKRAGLELYNLSIAEVMREAGYATAAVVHGWFTEAFGLLQGFDWVSYERRLLPAGIDTTLEWLRQWQEIYSDRPFFLLSYSDDVHYEFMRGRGPDDHIFGARHDGFNFSGEILREFRKGKLVPSEDDIRNAFTLYDEGLYWADHEIQRLLDGLDEMGLRDTTIIVFVSDHGEEFNEHGILSHGQSNFATVVDVPLIIVDPRYEGGKVAQERVMNIDVMPTLLDLCGIPVPETAKGSSLAPLVRGEPQPELEGRHIFSEGAWNGFVGAVWAGRYKYLMGKDGDRYLFDLEADPNEARNLAEELPDLTGRLEEMFFRHKRDGLATQILLKLEAPLTLNRIALPDPKLLGDVSSAVKSDDARPTLSEGSIEQLKALGYLE